MFNFVNWENSNRFPFFTSEAGDSMRFRFLFVLVVFNTIVGCAEIPKQSVELSATLGKDLTEVQRSHLKLVDLYHSKLEADANKFVDRVYAPYQIQKTLAEFQGPLVDAITKGASPSSSVNDKREAFEMLEVYLSTVRENVETFRTRTVAPILSQKALVTTRINETYANMFQANGAVTGYLASVVRVKDMQNEILAKLGAPNLQEQISTSLADTSEQIDRLAQRAATGKEKIEKLASEFEVLMQKAGPK